MYEIDKEKFGSFVAQLRKEQGMTQKELAQKVYISDKAVSKWERGLSMPDITLLIPLSQTLGITVMELLECQRMERTAMDSDRVEELMHKVISYSEETPAERKKRRWQESALFVVSLAVVALELLGLWALGYSWENIGLNILTYEPLLFFFSGYFCFFAKDKLPAYYDAYKIDAYSDGIFRMNLPGIRFNNRNWPYIKRAAIRGMLISAIALPVLYFLCGLLLPAIVETTFVFVCMPLFFIAFFAPMYVAAKRYA
ncbi:MAG: helix-turn-helix domain-containing protein [Roseburia sp.]|nr:helix-turn-helix domain-containing protein [Roseburia sp.]